MKIWQSKISLEDLNNRCKNTLSDHLGIIFIELGDDYLCAKMAIEQIVKQPMGIMHGGATCALAETVGSAAANFCVDNRLKVCVGLDININHIKTKESGYVVATARPFHMGKSTQVWEIIIEDEEENLVSVSRLTMAVIDRKTG